MKAAAGRGPLQGILGYEKERPLVSADLQPMTRGRAYVDAPSTMVVNGTQVKLYVLVRQRRWAMPTGWSTWR